MSILTGLLDYLKNNQIPQLKFSQSVNKPRVLTNQQQQLKKKVTETEQKRQQFLATQKQQQQQKYQQLIKPVEQKRQVFLQQQQKPEIKQTQSKELGRFFGSIAQAPAQAAVRIGLTGAGMLRGQQISFKPEDKILQTILGKEELKGVQQPGEQFGLKGNPAILVGGILTGLDLLPLFGAGEKEITSVAKIISKTEKTTEIIGALKKVVKGSEEEIATLAKSLVKETQPNRVEQVIKANLAVQKTTKELQSLATVKPILQGEKELGRVTTLKELENIKPENLKGITEALGTKTTYKPKVNAEIVSRIKRLAVNNPDKLAQFATRADDVGVVASDTLMTHYLNLANKTEDIVIKNAFLEKAGELGLNSAHTLLEAGRTVQAASIISKLDPAAIIRYAQSTLLKASKTNPAIKALSTDEIEQLMILSKNIFEATGDVEKAKGLQKVTEYIQDLIPSTLGQKIATVWKAGLLTGIKTSGLNTFSNAANAILEEIKNIPATTVDTVASLFSKTRTKTLTTAGRLSGFKEGLQKGWTYLTTGFDERNVGTKFDYKRISFGKGKIAKAIQAGEESIFRLMGAEDQPFYYMAKARLIYEQAKVSAMNKGLKGSEFTNYVKELVANPTDKIVGIATKDAQLAVYQNSTRMSEAASAMAGKLGVAGEYLMPFRRTPTAVAMQVLNYTPVGIVKTLAENIGKGHFDQKMFAEGLGRGITGTAALYLGYGMAKNDLITAGYPTKEKDRAEWEATGKQANSIKIGNQWVQAQVLGAAGFDLVIGAYLYNGIKEKGSVTEGTKIALGGLGKVITDQTFLRGVSGALAAINDPVQSAATYINQMASSNVPTIVSDIARATDPYQRMVDSTLDALMSRIPGLSEQLPAKVDILGKTVPRSTSALNTMINPLRPTDITNPYVLTKLDTLKQYNSGVIPSRLTNKVEIGERSGDKAIKLTDEELSKYKKFVGLELSKTLRAALADQRIRSLSKPDQADAITAIIENVHRATKLFYMRKIHKISPAFYQDQLNKAGGTIRGIVNSLK